MFTEIASSRSARIALASQMVDYSIGFVQVGEVGRALLGSGTFVSEGETRGILTARAVAERLPTRGMLGIALRTELNQIVVDTAELTHTSAPARPGSALDELGLVTLSGTAARRLSQLKPFVDLRSLSHRATEDSDSDDWFWCVNGFTDELTTTDLPLDCFDMVRGYTNVTGVASEPITQPEAAQDRLDLTVSRLTDQSQAMSFGGLVGGSVWRARGRIGMTPDAEFVGVVVDAPSSRQQSGSIHVVFLERWADAD